MVEGDKQKFKLRAHLCWSGVRVEEILLFLLSFYSIRELC